MLLLIQLRMSIFGGSILELSCCSILELSRCSILELSCCAKLEKIVVTIKATIPRPIKAPPMISEAKT